jgi:hypothetical protein
MLMDNPQNLLYQKLHPLPFVRQRRWSLISEDSGTMVSSMSLSTVPTCVEVTTTVVAVTSPTTRLADEVVGTVGGLAYALAGA